MVRGGLPAFAAGVQASQGMPAAPPHEEEPAVLGTAGGWSASSTIPTAGVYVAPATDEVRAPVEPWVQRRTGWAAPDPAAHHQVLEAARQSPYRTELDKRAAGNAIWMMLAALASGGVLAVVYLVYWYRRVVLAQVGGAPAVFHHSAKLLAPGYAQWRIILPIAAVACIALSLFTALAWHGKRYPRLLVLLIRLSGLTMVGTTVAAQLARTPHYTGGLGHLINVVQSEGAVYSYHLSTAGWFTLGLAIVAFACTLPITSEMR
jgi:hypothetical protein